MFKVSGFDLPEAIKAEQAKSKDKGKKKDNRKGDKNEPEKPTADSLQSLFNSLGRGEKEDSAPKRKPLEDAEPPVPAKKAKADARKAAKKARKANSKAEAAEDNSLLAAKQEKSKDTSKSSGKAASKDAVKSDVSSSKQSKAPAAKPSDQKHSAPSNVPVKANIKLTPMQLKMQQKLSGARFRWINEQLYTIPSDDALTLFKKQPHVFDEYHQGFRHQVESWPENPVDNMVSNFKARLQKPLNAPGGLPAEKNGDIVVADMGCGEAQLALELGDLKGGPKSRRARFWVHSFDLHEGNDRITVADISNVPLEDNSVNVVVYCLALMGTNIEDFIKEGLRILKPGGEIWIAEIKSRFDRTDDGSDVSRFVNKLKSLGLHHKSTDDSNKMFVRFEFVNLPQKEKTKFIEAEEDSRPLLKPCIYKRRRFIADELQV